MADFNGLYGNFLCIEQVTKDARQQYQEAAREMLEPVIKDVAQAYGLTGWDFLADDGYNDEGSRWQQFSHNIEAGGRGDYLDESSADSFTGVIDMLKDCEVNEINPRQVTLTSEQEHVVDTFMSSPEYLFTLGADHKVKWVNR